MAVMLMFMMINYSLLLCTKVVLVQIVSDYIGVSIILRV